MVAFDIPSGNENGKVVVARMPANSGTLLDNLNRWRGQVHLDPLTDPSQIPSQTLKIGGIDAMMWDIGAPAVAQPSSAVAPESQPRAAVPHSVESQGSQPGAAVPQAAQQGIVVAMLTRGSEWWFFKLQGPATIVSAKKLLPRLPSIRPVYW